MPDPPLQVARWSEVFETADSRRHKRLSWVSMPVDFMSTGYQDLVERFGDEAPAMYGAWCALVQVAAQAPTRGRLVSNQGTPWSASSIARRAHMDAPEVFARLIEWASSEDVGWLEFADNQPPTSPETTSNQSSNELPNLTSPNQTRPDPTYLPNQTGPGAGRQAAGRQVVTDEQWERAKPRARVIRDRCGGGRKLDDRNRGKAVLWACLADQSPQVAEVLDELLDDLRERDRSNNMPRKPFGYLQTALANELRRRHGIDYHELAAGLEIPGHIAQPKTEAVTA